MNTHTCTSTSCPNSFNICFTSSINIKNCFYSWFCSIFCFKARASAKSVRKPVAIIIFFASTSPFSVAILKPSAVLFSPVTFVSISSAPNFFAWAILFRPNQDQKFQLHRNGFPSKLFLLHFGCYQE